jgi:hypothetical protein
LVQLPTLERLVNQPDLIADGPKISWDVGVVKAAGATLINPEEILVSTDRLQKLQEITGVAGSVVLNHAQNMSYALSRLMGRPNLALKKPLPDVFMYPRPVETQLIIDESGGEARAIALHGINTYFLATKIQHSSAIDHNRPNKPGINDITTIWAKALDRALRDSFRKLGETELRQEAGMEVISPVSRLGLRMLTTKPGLIVNAKPELITRPAQSRGVKLLPSS